MIPIALFVTNLVFCVIMWPLVWVTSTTVVGDTRYGLYAGGGSQPGRHSSRHTDGKGQKHRR